MHAVFCWWSWLFWSAMPQTFGWSKIQGELARMFDQWMHWSGKQHWSKKKEWKCFLEMNADPVSRETVLQLSMQREMCSMEVWEKVWLMPLSSLLHVPAPFICSNIFSCLCLWQSQLIRMCVLWQFSLVLLQKLHFIAQSKVLRSALHQLSFHL